MLFNSVEFIFVFLPIVLVVFCGLRRLGYSRLVYVWLAFASLFYYGYWKPVYLWLILCSIVFNYLAGRSLCRLSMMGASRRARLVLIVSSAVNLLLLAYFKYTYFITDTVTALTGVHFSLPCIVLPLGISFFTFQQIAYLVDAHDGKTNEYNFFHYCLFVTFFPQLIAGPIVHHREMLTQFEEGKTAKLSPDDFAQGVTFFSAGLFKKIMIADVLASYASPFFTSLAGGSPLSFASAWLVILAYTFQIYFDFSGYSDMALGLGKMFGINLPENFNSPYKAASVADFWRRWHITLSMFLRDYLYIPLGGGRSGAKRRYINLLLTMLIGGLWHGAGWLFVVWGLLHGIYLCINHGWRAVLARNGEPAFTRSVMWSFFARCVTFLSVVFAWVFFRSESLTGAGLLIKGMAGMCGFSEIPAALHDLPRNLFWAAFIAWFLPNTAEFVFRRYKGWPQFPFIRRITAWQPTVLWAIVFFILMFVSIGYLNRISEFIYYQF